jgi:hypothetical protein
MIYEFLLTIAVAVALLFLWWQIQEVKTLAPPTILTLALATPVTIVDTVDTTYSVAGDGTIKLPPANTVSGIKYTFLPHGSMLQFSTSSAIYFGNRDTQATIFGKTPNVYIPAGLSNSAINRSYGPLICISDGDNGWFVSGN